MMRIGVCGTGTIASWVSSILNQLADPEIELYACATAPGFDCTKFAEQFGWKKICADYDELMNDPMVDVVYVAVPNNFHREMCLKALNAGKNVVCEKPFAINEKEAKEILDLAEEKGLFCSEALWPSFLPSHKWICEQIAAGRIGRVVSGSIIMLDNVMFLGRVKDLALGGGSLLDGGPYTLGCLTDYFGTDFASIESKTRKLDTGVDAEDEIWITYKDGRKVYVRQTCDMDRDHHDNHFEIVGTEGRITGVEVANHQDVKLLDNAGNVVETYEVPPQIHNQGMPPVSGYEHEWIAFKNAIAAGKQETEQAPHAQTLAIAHIMTEVRKNAGIVFPFES